VELLRRLPSLGISETDFQDPIARKAYRFVVEHHRAHGKLPTLSVLQGVIGAEVPECEGDPDWLVKELLRRKLFVAVQDHQKEIGEALQGNDPVKALGLVTKFSENNRFALSGKRPTSVMSLGDGMIAQYHRLAAGERGIEMPWPSVTDTTAGLWPGTTTYLIARAGVGKTNAGWIVARKAWKDGYRVLFVSAEMFRDECAERFFLFESGVSSSQYIRGKLTDFHLSDLKKTIAVNRNKSGLDIVDPDDGLSPEELDGYIRASKPNLIVVDALYNLPFGGRDRTENLKKAVDWFRENIRIYRRLFGTAMLATHQLSRDALKARSAGGMGYTDGAIALSDQLFWDAYSVWVMEQTPEMKKDRRMKLHCAKIRRGTWPKGPVLCHWDFDKMLFDEIEQTEEFEDTEASTKAKATRAETMKKFGRQQWTRDPDSVPY
jgi:hypothetical protein